MEEPMVNVVGAMIAELRDDPDVAAIVGTRVRHAMPLGEVHDATTGALVYDGDAHGSGEYKAFIVLVVLSDPPVRRVPVQFLEVVVRCYGTTRQGARELYGAVVKTFHDRGVRVKSNGTGVWRSAMVGGGSDDTDPKTSQPLVIGNIQLIAATVVVT
jgi:hypothetical protein